MDTYSRMIDGGTDDYYDRYGIGWSDEKLEAFVKPLGITTYEAKLALVAGGYLKRVDSLESLLDDKIQPFLERWARFPNLRDQIESFGSLWHSDDLELAPYECMHNTIDLVCWLLKMRYATREELKKRHFTLPRLVMNFLKESNFSLLKIKKLEGDTPNLEKFKEYLQRGWYDEFWRILPGIGTDLRVVTDQEKDLPGSFSTAWNVAQAYYSTYNYITALVFTNAPSLNTVQHKKPLKHFDETLFRKFCGNLIKYPLNITSTSTTTDVNSLRGPPPKAWSYQYACNRRWGRPLEMEKTLVKALGRWKTVVNCLYDFRVWGNYTGIKGTMALDAVPNYQIYLHKNLNTLVCFYALPVEIMALAVLGEQDYLEVFSHFLEKNIAKNFAWRANYLFLPHIVRLRAYEKVGLVKDLPPILRTLAPPDPFDL